MTKRLSILALLVVLSLVPAVLLYILFGDLNNADITVKGRQVIQLGGPTAVFFLTLSFLWRMYKYIYVKENPLETMVQNLIGSWKVESESGTSGRKANSDTRISFRDGQLEIDGGTFFDVGPKGEKGDSIGDWNVDIAVSDGRRVKYFYTLRDSISARTWTGVVEMIYQNDATPAMHGRWQVIGNEYHSGKISMTKKT